MMARWNLKTTAAGIEVSYDNLRERVSLNCGVTTMTVAELLAFMVSEGGTAAGASEIVMVDGGFGYMLMPAAADDWPFLTNTFELQG